MGYLVLDACAVFCFACQGLDAWGLAPVETAAYHELDLCSGFEAFCRVFLLWGHRKGSFTSLGSRAPEKPVEPSPSGLLCLSGWLVLSRE